MCASLAMHHFFQVWKYAEATGNEKWKGLAWGMVPSHASGVAACTYHFFFNAKAGVPLVTLQVVTLRSLGSYLNEPLALLADGIILPCAISPSAV